jgi:hypothetical protein
MLAPLRTDRRRTLLRGSLFALAGALLLTPLALPPAEPAQAGAIPSVAANAPQLAESPEPKLIVVRDPFVPDAAVQSADATQTDGVDGTGIVVEAVVLGDSPRALVRLGATNRIVRAGDAVGDSVVRAIDERGVVLEGGETLPLAVPR